MDAGKSIKLVRSYSHIFITTLLGVIALAEGYRLGMAFENESFIAGPGGYIFIIGAALTLFSSVMVVKAVISRKTPVEGTSEIAKKAQTPEQTRRLKQMRLSFVLCVLYVVLIKPLGFAIASIVYLASSLALLRNSLKTTLITCAVMIPVLYFGLPAIGISVPKGIFGF